MTPRIDFHQINHTIALNAANHLERWLPGGVTRGNEYVCAGLGGGAGESCSVSLDSGVGSDFATGEAWGDFVSLYATLHGIKQGEAAIELQGELGMAVQYPQKTERTSAIMPIPENAPAPPATHIALGTPAQGWTYKNRQGAPLFFVARFNQSDGKKQFRPLCWTSRGWDWRGMPDKDRPLYGLELLTDDRPVLLVEGEKACDAARRLVGDVYDCLTWPNGSNSVRKVDFSPLKARKVTIWPDHDLPGLKCAHELVSILGGLGCEVSTVLPPQDRAEGWDIADAETEGWTKESVLQWLANNASGGGSLAVEEIMRTEYVYDPVICGLLDMKETVLLVAPGGVGKSLMTLQIAFELAREQDVRRGNIIDLNAPHLFGKFRIPKQRRVLILQSENNEGPTQRRIKKMLQARPDFASGFKNVTFCKGRNGIRETGCFTDEHFSARIIAEVKRLNVDVLIVDPLISFHNADENDNGAMRRSLDCITHIQDETGIAVILVHHAGKVNIDSKGNTSMSTTGRGASAIGDWAGCIINLLPVENKKQDGLTYIKADVTKNRMYEKPFPFTLVRDTSLVFSELVEELPEDKAEDIAKVVLALEELGGQCGRSNDLAVAVMNKHHVKPTTAKTWIGLAREAGKLFMVENPDDKRSFGYRIPTPAELEK